MEVHSGDILGTGGGEFRGKIISGLLFFNSLEQIEIILFLKG